MQHLFKLIADTVTNTSLIVGLDAYWEYSVTVSAITDGVGERKSQTEFITTKEAGMYFAI